MRIVAVPGVTLEGSISRMSAWTYDRFAVKLKCSLSRSAPSSRPFSSMNQSFFSRRGFFILFVFVFLMPFILKGTRLTLESNRNDVKDWLPESYEETDRHRWFTRHFPFEQFALVSWEGCTLDDWRLKRLAEKLENQPEDEKKAGELWFFKSVITGDRLVKTLQQRYEDLSEEEILRRLEGSLIGKDHDKTCLIVILSEDAKGKNLRATLEKIKYFAVEEVGIPKEDLHMGGPPVDNVAIDHEGEKTLVRLSGLSAVIGLSIAWLCFRNFRLTFLVFFVGLLGAGISLASVYYSGVVARLFGWNKIADTYATCDAILLSMPSLVYVLSISGAIHIVNYYHDAVRENGLHGAPERALKHGMVPCALAAFTTALGLGSLLASPLVPIAKFGIYSAWGVMASLALLFLYLPATLQFFPSVDYVPGGARNPHGESSESIFVSFWRGVGNVVIARNKLVTVVCLLVMAFFAVGLTRIGTSIKLMKLFDPDADIIHDYEWLEEHIGPLVPMEVVVRIDNEKCKLNMVQRIRLVRDLDRVIETELKDDVGGALSVATFAPDVGRTPATAKRRFAYSVRDNITSRLLEGNRDEFGDYLRMQTSVKEHNPSAKLRDATLEQLGIQGELASRLKRKQLDSLLQLQAYGDMASIKGVGIEGETTIRAAIADWQAKHGIELWRVSARVEALGDLDYSEFIHTLKDVVEKDLDAKYRVLTAEERASGAVPVEGIEVVYTGLVPLVYKAQHELLRGLYNSLMWAFALIAVVMILVLRSPTAGLLSMLPNMFPVVIVFGAMGWLGILVDVGTMMTAGVALGVAVDDTVHFLAWFRRALDQGLDRKGAVLVAYERCGTAMSQTTLIGGLGLSAFAFSTFTPTQRFGVLMLTMLSVALLGDLIFLPALLAGPVGRFFRSKHSVGDSSPDEDDEESAANGEVIAMPISSAVSEKRRGKGRSHRAS